MEIRLLIVVGILLLVLYMVYIKYEYFSEKWENFFTAIFTLAIIDATGLWFYLLITIWQVAVVLISLLILVVIYFEIKNFYEDAKTQAY